MSFNLFNDFYRTAFFERKDLPLWSKYNKTGKRFDRDAENMQIAVITNNAEEFKEDLIYDAPSPIEYSSPKPESVYAEDELISKYELNIEPGDIKVLQVEELFK